MTDQRKICYDILLKYETEHTFVNLLLKDMLSHNEPYTDFITEIVYGVIRYRRFLDYKIQKYSSIKMKKISTPVLVILRIGFYQLDFMNSVPDFAVINESVRLCTKTAYKSKGFVNAVLRKGALREEEQLSWEVKYSFSDEMISTIKSQYKKMTEDILKGLNTKTSASIRINTLKISEEEFIKLYGDENLIKDNGCLFLKGALKKDLYDKGFYTIQSISSQLAVKILDPKKDEVVIDICCAPGGKTAYIAELMNNTGLIIGFELYEHRAELTRKNLLRLGVTNTNVITGDSTVYHEQYKASCDRILCDVPCSGWGVIGSKPDIKWQHGDIDSLIEIQKKILNNAKKYLKTNGILVYSTCTINKNENENLISEFLTENKNFEFVPFEITENGETTVYNKMVQLLPDKRKIGFFIAKLRKCFDEEKS